MRFLGLTPKALARDVLPVVVVAWIVFHELRSSILERYLVPSPSMEPTLHGDEADGDVVLVDKTAWWSWRRGRPRPFDLVVVRDPERNGGNNLVKRLIAVGPADVELEEGDVFVHVTGVIGDPRIVKHPLEHEDLRMTSFVVDPAAGVGLDFLQPAPETWRVDGGAIVLGARRVDELRGVRAEPRSDGAERWLPGHLSTARPMDSSFLDVHGLRVPGGRVDVRDVGLDLMLTLEGPVDALHLVVELLEVRYALECALDGTVVLRREDVAVGEPVQGARLPGDRPFRLRFGYLDAHLFVAVDDALSFWRQHEVPWRSPRELVLPGPYHKPPANLLHLCVAGDGGAARILGLAGFHDVHYEPSDVVYRLEPGDIFVLGDNSYDSSDSRQRLGDPFRLGDLVGRPLAILAPLHRMRWL